VPKRVFLPNFHEFFVNFLPNFHESQISTCTLRPQNRIIGRFAVFCTLTFPKKCRRYPHFSVTTYSFVGSLWSNCDHAAFGSLLGHDAAKSAVVFWFFCKFGMVFAITNIIP